MESRYSIIRSYCSVGGTRVALRVLGEDGLVEAKRVAGEVMSAGHGKLSRKELLELEKRIEDNEAVFLTFQGGDLLWSARDTARKNFDRKSSRLSLVFTCIAALMSAAAVASAAVGMPAFYLAAIASLFVIAAYVVIERFWNYGSAEKFLDWLDKKVVCLYPNERI